MPLLIRLILGGSITSPAEHSVQSGFRDRPCNDRFGEACEILL